MHPHRAPLCWWCHGASPLQVGVGLIWMAVTPRRLRPFCSGTLCGRGYRGWFSPSTGRRSGLYVHPVGVAPVPTRSGPQVTKPGYPGLSQFIWWYPWLTPDIKNYPVFTGRCSGAQWRFEEESRDPPPPRGNQALRWMKYMAWVPR